MLSLLGCAPKRELVRVFWGNAVLIAKRYKTYIKSLIF